jgi:hypothetical protein
MLLLMIVLVGAGVSAAVAASKNRNPIGWLIFGALLPLIAVICAFVVAPLPSDALDAPRL